MLTKAPKGTKDVLPSESYKWIYLENTIRDLARLFGYQEIRTPIFEHTELFQRGVGDTTDIVQKEMYTFEDKAGRSITLKPEGTAGAVRAFIEGKLYSEPQPTKMYYLTPVFRYERPQAGRYRQHHQFGVEVFGAYEASVDAEIISLAMALFNKIGIRNLELNINSIGCPQCRGEYHKVLVEFLSKRKDRLCKTCNERLLKNPLRVLDCKIPECKEAMKDAPLILDYLCEDCRSHFHSLQRYLDLLGIPYKINPMIVRGLDYYTKTVFEIISTNIGSQGTICGGGRYDGLVEQIGGPSMAGIGFGMGLERVLLEMESQNIAIPKLPDYDAFVITIGEEAKEKAFSLVYRMRLSGISADLDHIARSVKAQFKYSNKTNAPFVCILGEDELKNGTVKVKDMKTGSEESILMDQLISYLNEKLGMEE